jgi:hypothetical protein
MNNGSVVTSAPSSEVSSDSDDSSQESGTYTGAASGRRKNQPRKRREKEPDPNKVSKFVAITYGKRSVDTKREKYQGTNENYYGADKLCLHNPTNHTEMITVPENEKIIAFSDNGTLIELKDTRAFGRDVLPKYYRHSNISSFTRQLNNYNFELKGKSFRLLFIY